MNETILSSFLRLRAADPDRVLFTFVDGAGQDEANLTVAQLGAAADRVVTGLRRAGYAAGDRAILVYQPSLDFIEAFLGCLAAGVLPVPVYPPNPFKLKRDLAVFSAIATDCGARGALTTSGYDRTRMAGAVTSLFSRDAPSWPGLAWHRTDRMRTPDAPVDWHPAGLDEPAFLQYTSGSTAAPKGVVISHGNLACETAANAADLGLGTGTRGVFWVPQYHDLGLISVVLSIISGNGHATLLSPLTFLQRPAVWFEVMSRVRATHTAAPNFAYELAVRKTTPAQRAGWDLSALRVIMSAAEPIRAATMDAFYAAFAPSGLEPVTFFPAYGLAEHTVSVTMGGRARLHLDRAELAAGRVLPVPAGAGGAAYVGCGRITKPDARLRIVDPDTCRPCGPDEVGEVWVDSPTKALGYWGMAEETRRAFQARVVGDDDPTGYLRTGDLGFLHDGELYITGRQKDLVIVRGRNVYPADLEESIRDCHPLVRPGGIAVFGVDDPAADAGADEPAGERLVVVVETRTDSPSAVEVEELVAAVRERVCADHQLCCHTVLVGRCGTVRKTTSGKVRRNACRQAFLSGELASAAGTLLVSERAPAGAPALTATESS
jgi:acyl-CoA synthetase (AMP-forming)/AMP-acid ligase II